MVSKLTEIMDTSRISLKYSLGGRRLTPYLRYEIEYVNALKKSWTVNGASRRCKPKPMAKSDIATILARIEEIVEEIRELRRASVLPRMPSQLEEAELSSVQERALQVLTEEGEMTSLEVAKALNRTRPLMVINLNQLAALGLVEKVRRGRYVYFRRKPPETPGIIGRELGGGCYLFVALVSDNWPENVEDMERLISERLNGLPGWRIEHIAVLPRPLAEDNEGLQHRP